MFRKIININWLYLYTLLKLQPIMYLNISWIRKILGSWIKSIIPDQYCLDIVIKSSKLKSVFLFLKNHTLTQFNILTDIACVDYPGKKERFELTYILLSIRYIVRLRVRITIGTLLPVNSVTSIFKGSDWLEREVWDLFGVFFFKHPDLRRILTDYGFDGHPLRKDFPLTGFIELSYDDSIKKLIYQPVSLAQEFRNYDFTNAWLLSHY